MAAVSPLLACTSWRELEDHARAICATSNPGQDSDQSSVAQILDQLENGVAAGLLACEADVSARLRAVLTAEHRPAACPPIRVLCIPTRDRAQQLARCMRSYLRNAQQHGRPLQVIVADDTSDATSSQNTARAAGIVADEFQAKVSMVTRADRRQLARELAGACGVPEHVVQFALLGDRAVEMTVGAARNTLLLATAGDLSVQVDDDTICSLREPPVKRTGVAFSSRADPCESWFEKDGELPCGAEANCDFIGEHEAVLGRAPGMLLGDVASTALIIQELSPRLLRGVADPDARVLVTQCGSVGDSGMEYPWWRFYLPEDPISRTGRSDHEYRRMLSRRDVTRASPALTIGDSGFCMAMNVGLDQRAVLPPFMPLGRSEDAVFMSALRWCRRGSLSGFIPLTLEHRPEGRAAHYDMSFESLHHDMRINDLVRLALEGFGWPASTDPVRNLGRLGHYLQDISAEAAPECARQLRATFVARRSRVIMELERRLGQGSTRGSAWGRLGRDYVDGLRRSLTHPDLLAPCDMRGPVAEREAQLRRVLLQYGQLLQQWPALIDAARGSSVLRDILSCEIGE